MSDSLIKAPALPGDTYVFIVLWGRTMKLDTLLRIVIWLVSAPLAGCGTYTPDKDPFSSDAPPWEGGPTSQGKYENDIVIHVVCEIGQGLRQAQRLNLPRIVNEWGTTVTQSITVEDQTGLAPGITATTPLHNRIFTFLTGGNVTASQLFSLSFGGTASANALRTETIQYTMRNNDILANTDPDPDCKNSGVMIDGDLKIREFIYDKAQIWALNNANLVGSGPLAYQANPFNTFTEEITFVASYGGTFTPTWKLARISANTSSNLLIGQRTNTNDLIITLGPVKINKDKQGKPIPYGSVPVQLDDFAVNQHQARVQANAIAVSVTGQSH